MSEKPRAGIVVVSDPSTTGRTLGLRAWARNSPWLMIAVLLHALLITIMSVVFIRSQRGDAAPDATEVRIARATPEPPAVPEELSEITPRRDVVPTLPIHDETALVSTVETPLFDAAAGRIGERTAETDPDLDPGLFNPDPDALSNLPSGSPGGTPHGVGRVGHYGSGVPSAFAGRIPGSGGKGKGGLGENGSNGPGREPRAAVSAALEWLKRHQSPDGSWDCDGFGAQCTGEPCDGIGSSAHDVGVSALALLAFLGEGHTHADGAYKDTVKRGLMWLMSVQDDEGCFGERIGQAFLYDHACAALALAEAYGMTHAKALREPAQKAIQFILRSENPYAAWRYASPPDGDNDTSVTGWMVMALKSAKLAGLTIDDQALQNALLWIDQMTDPASGRTGYTEVGGRPSRLGALQERFPSENSESLTAVGVLVRIFAGHTLENDPLIAKGAERMSACLPRWSSESGHIDFYYWYYGTLAMFQVGGPRWERWNEAIQSAILAHQHLDPSACEWGSWDALDPWSSIGGRVYATALNCLSMEVYYRYARVLGPAGAKK